MTWSIDGNDLNTKPRSGGAVAEKGFTFQKAYALVRLTWLLTGERKLIEIRYEGAQDVDLRFADGSEVLTQAKDYKPGNFTYDNLKDVIAGFARDLITVTARGIEENRFPHFHLVCTSAPDDEKSFQILRHVYKQTHAAAIEPLIQDDYRENLSQEDVMNCLQSVLEKFTAEIIFNECAIQDLEAQACWNLVRFGVPPENVQLSLANLKTALIPRSQFQISDVVDKLVGLPQGHPGSEGGACRFLPAIRQLVFTSTMRRAFLRGSAQSLWAAIYNGLDAGRTEAGAITQTLQDLNETGGMVVVEGPSGTGKSALVRRIAWDAHCTGSHLVLEITVPGQINEANWKAIFHLLQHAHKPLLLIIDDIWRHRGFVEALELHMKPRLCILATSRPVNVSQQINSSMLAVHTVKLGPLSDEVVISLRRLVQVDKDSDAVAVKVTAGQVERFKESGQLLALSLTLQGGSLDRFVRDMVLSLRGGSFNDFLDLCVAGGYDLSVPLSLFSHSNPGDTPFWQDERFIGLVSVQETSYGTSRLKVGHSLVARAIVEVEHVNLVDRAIHFCSVCSPGMVDERRFVIHLLKNVLRDPDRKREAQSKAKPFVTAVKRLLDDVSFADAHRLSQVIESIDNSLRQEFLRVATPERIIDAVDIGLALSRKSHAEFAAFFPRIFEFFGREITAPGRRRFVTLALGYGTTEHQTMVAAQTVNWVMQQQFPVGEMMAVLSLGNSAKEKQVTFLLEPMISAYLKLDNIEEEILCAAVLPVRRMDNAELSSALIRRVLDVLESTTAWLPPQLKLVKFIGLLVEKKMDEMTRVALANLFIKVLKQVSDHAIRKKVIVPAIILAAPDSIEYLRGEIEIMKNQDLEEADNIYKFFRHKFAES